MEKSRAVIYLRKSTDRDDKQQISIETQRQHCERLASDYGFDFIIIEDHKSAKEENKREGFKKMLSLCKKGGFDYVIAYDPTRISRNTIDAAYFTELINKQHIKGFYAAESRQFFNGTDIFSALMLGISFLMSKADNQMRASNVKRKMETLLQEWRVMWKTPFGYKNLRFFNESGQLIKDVVVVEKEAEIVLKAFEMRSEGKQFRAISEYLASKGYKRDAWAVQKMLRNPFYAWIQRWRLGEAEIKMNGYRPIVPFSLFERVNSIKRPIRGLKRVSYDPFLKGLVFDSKRKHLIAYETTNALWKPYVYYRARKESPKKFNFSQLKLLAKFDAHMKSFAFSREYLESLETALKDAFVPKNAPLTERMMIREELAEIEESRKVLTQKLVIGTLSDEDYKEAVFSYLKRKKLLEEKDSGLKNDVRNWDTLMTKLVELVGNLLPAYENKGPWRKVQVLKVIQVELFVRDDLSLSIKENELLKLIKSNFLSFGGPKETRTPDLFHAMEAF